MQTAMRLLSLLALTALLFLTPGSAADEDVPPLSGATRALGPSYCAGVASDQMPPVWVDPDNCRIPEAPDLPPLP